jgi:hypothetical protein|uniref:Uncharacterized protein n=1 Tax=Zea mays TaxID=4577 RepID=A0A804RE79_MAIZE
MRPEAEEDAEDEEEVAMAYMNISALTLETGLCCTGMSGGLKLNAQRVLSSPAAVVRAQQRGNPCPTSAVVDVDLELGDERRARPPRIHPYKEIQPSTDPAFVDPALHGSAGMASFAPRRRPGSEPQGEGEGERGEEGSPHRR